jgi:hypothetical protein
VLNGRHCSIDDGGVVAEEKPAKRRRDAEEEDALPPQSLLRRVDQHTLRCRLSVEFRLPNLSGCQFRTPPSTLFHALRPVDSATDQV